MTTQIDKSLTSFKFKLIQNRWFLVSVVFALFYVFVNVNFVYTYQTTNLQWTQDLSPFVSMMPLHIGLFLSAMVVYGIGWFKRNRLICGLYFIIMIFGLYTGPLFYPYQFIMAVLITMGMIKITKINGLVYR